MPSATETNGTTSTSIAPDPEQKPADPEELSNSIDQVLQKLTAQFKTQGDEMLAKMDDMSRRLDGLEAQLRAADKNKTKADSNPQTPSNTNGPTASSESGGGK